MLDNDQSKILIDTFNRAITLASQGGFEEAIEDLRLVAQQLPNLSAVTQNVAAVLYNHAVTLIDSQDHDRAVPYLREALTHAPDYQPAQKALILALFAQLRQDIASHQESVVIDNKLLEILRLQPGHENALKYLFAIIINRVENQDWDNALSILVSLIKDHPTQYYAFAARSIALKGIIDTAYTLLQDGERSKAQKLYDLAFGADSAVCCSLHHDPNRPLASILCPTRARVKDALRLADTVYATVSKPERVEILYYVDYDDPQLALYQQAFEDYAARNPRSRVRVVEGYDGSVSIGWNTLAFMATGSVLIMGNDDVIYQTNEWDVLLEQAVSPFEDGIYCAWFNDLIGGPTHCAFPMVSTRWMEILGRYTPGLFQFGYNDTWIHDIAQALGRVCYISEVMAEHLHVSFQKSAEDETSSYNTLKWRADRSVYWQTHNHRMQEVQYLAKYMKLSEFF